MEEESVFEKVIKMIPFESAIESGIKGYFDMANRFGNYYAKRRQVGFTIRESITGGFGETKSYVHAKWTGTEFKELKPAFTYVNGIENNDK